MTRLLGLSESVLRKANCRYLAVSSRSGVCQKGYTYAKSSRDTGNKIRCRHGGQIMIETGIVDLDLSFQSMGFGILLYLEV